MFQPKNKKRNIFKQLSLLSVVSAVGIIASACTSAAQPTGPEFKTGFVGGTQNQGFIENDSIFGGREQQASTILTSALKNSDAFQALLSTSLGEVLTEYYKHSKSEVITNKYENFKEDVDNQLDTLKKDNQNVYGNNWKKVLQTQSLDVNGGTEDSYKKNQIAQKVLGDFSNTIFETSYLTYAANSNKNQDGYTTYTNLTKTPSRTILDNPENWKNIKFTDGGFSKDDQNKNNNEFMAKIQEYVFDQWVKNENPNLVSRIVFTNDTPKDGLNSIFNERQIGASALTAGYNFQAFKAPSDQPFDENKGMRAYNQFIRDGLDAYVNTTTKGIDIPNNFSSDSGGKLLMTASDMFNSYDVSFSAAYVQQYLEQTHTVHLDNVGPAQTTIDKINLMNNFIRNGTPGYQEQFNNKEALLKENDESRTSNEYYNAYKDLASGKNSIYEIFKWNGQSNGDKDKNKSAEKFIFARGKDGIHVIAIDGGDYYLKGTHGPDESPRDIEKQKQFLLYRSLLKSSVNLPENQNYEFNIDSQIKSYFEKNKNLYTYLALSQMYEQSLVEDNKQDNIFNQEGLEDFKASFKKLYDRINKLVKAESEYQQALSLETQTNNVRAKIYERAKGFEDNEKSHLAINNGIASKLPYVRSSDGSYNGLEQFYLDINGLKHTEESKGTVETIEQNKKTKLEARNKEIADFVESLGIQTKLVDNDSQATFLTASKLESPEKDDVDLALNMAINSYITGAGFNNQFKIELIKSSKEFSDFYDIKSHKVKEAFGIQQKTLEDVIRNVYKFSTFNSLSDKTSKGVYNDFKSLNAIIDKVWDAQDLDNNSSSDLTFNYYKFLYTFRWLLDNNLANFKEIAKSNIKKGEVGFATWTLPLDPTKQTNPLITFDKNPDGILGSKTSNWKNWNQEDSKKIDEANYWNNSSLTYKVSTSEEDNKQTPKTPQFGFAGLVFKNSNAPINEETKNALFTNYNTSGDQGVFYGYGSKDSLIAYVNELQSERELDNLAREITETTRVSNNDYFKLDDNKKSLSYTSKVEEITKMINKIPESAFKKFTGYIGTQKENEYKLNNTLFVKNSLRRIATYVKQINYDDVNKLGGEGWLNKPEQSLGLTTSELLTVIAMSANNATVQNEAIKQLSDNNRFVVNDVRVYNSLGTSFSKKRD
ncbi:DUF3713 domain-containing protein [Mycoplasma sp. E35C]|uniref:DUF3713 domain-containing protein n=1 Tax=Mycoplasma sp. E35C TaxID=2801918 RepID=UPI001CA40266|nr:DUF3713 domain-containing protein [Mycoplasma sp. E35C]QZX48998.1 hypothetical protein JJE79_03000 [Mycoplasma sp. E35C]